jgi:L-alanine-DL-glutamate epimerase-like enolase superfamily enzyme
MRADWVDPRTPCTTSAFSIQWPGRRKSFTDSERDPLQAELFADPPKIANGRLRLKEAPGLGLALSDAALKKYGERIV